MPTYVITRSIINSYLHINQYTYVRMTELYCTTYD